ncbi:MULTISPECIES: histidine kinase [Kitasatospora]|uniref:histidine kinase n=1 Tax=Kitasatospora setae (strain ATCC 33774 / DSM 43861 / JCM 3304 / KCC A-0304 / NBRC 14216 / KM-6054) TaxID=452652 RepID=E4NBK9_KITSK|nr:MULTISPECIES: histidine kinase [Kitasatospora]BAJ28590.1 putative two-component system sensor kinase [Kitasatospora setae KM-6054]
MDVLRPLGPRWQAVADAAVAAALAALPLFSVWDVMPQVPRQADLAQVPPPGFGPGPRPADVLLVLLAALAAPLARRRPVAALLAVLSAAALGVGVSNSPAPWVAVAVVLYRVPRALPPRPAGRLLALSLAVAGLCLSGMLGWTWPHPGFGGPGAVVMACLFLATGWTAGWAVDERRRRRIEHEASRQREERLLIARELHDVVAHSLGVIAVQAGVANHVAAEQPEQARLALASIEETSRTALNEMRALLGVLRTGGDGAGDGERLPAPRLSDLDGVVRRAAAAGVRVDVQLLGERAELPPGLELAGYRVVQEAVTNVVRHAGTDRCLVRVGYRPDALELTVTDEGRGGSPSGAGGGHGLAGMRERVAVHGGEFRAGRRAAGRGFEVSAVFPLAVTG